MELLRLLGRTTALAAHLHARRRPRRPDRLSRADRGPRRNTKHADALHELLLDQHAQNGAFIKHTGSDEVDASLLWLATPFAVTPADDSIM
ncbi:MAG TPA: hypothetical protein VFN75_02365 [Pseudonocardiaceae bacterium]|nr:hypothetical protein [Pseudonocardiaceae bacterium]